jgi:hypothetical protein
MCRSGLPKRWDCCRPAEQDSKNKNEVALQDVPP